MSPCKIVLSVLAVLGFALPAMAADLPSAPPAQPKPPVFSPGWTFRLTPYAWATSLNGSQTVKGRTFNVDASFVDIIDNTIGDGGSLVALMLDMEARNGPFALMADIIGEKITVNRSGLRSRSVVPAVTGTLGAAADLQIQMAIVEAGGAYEIGHIGPVAFDILVGGRYWYQKVDVGLDFAGTLDLGDLVLTGTRAIARSGSVDWVDAFAGARARFDLAPGHHIELRGDLGGGGSKFTWNALAAYAYDFTTSGGTTYSAVIGYKALYVDYVQGAGRNRYEFDMLQHGPVIGLNIRF